MGTASEQPENLSPTKRALLALKQMQAKLEALERAQNEPIAIIGMGCRFPGGADNPEAFWQLLRDGVDAITEVPSDRWNINTYYDSNPDTPGKICNRYGGFVPHLQEFDAQFFRMAPREALSLDPQQRLLLEVSWEALENAGLAPDKLMGSQTGVFIGICSTDYWHRLLSRKPTEIDAYLTTGNTHSMASGRLSYIFGFNGPSLSIDTACSSSLVAVHLACQSLRNQECNLALAGGVNRILAPEASINFSKAKMLSSDGRCKTFDASADGFVRAEGCGAIVLKRLSDAVAAGDNIFALICGSAVNQDGRTSGLTVPNGLSQQAAIEQALKNSRIEPHQIDYIETHGTGTALGDPIEIGAIGEVFGKERSSDRPLIIGSVKTNIGHLEAAAGIASLIKVVLALQNEEIPPNLHFQVPNPHINWKELPIKVPTQRISWLRGEKPRLAGVSSFGFNGTNAHVVVRESGVVGAGLSENSRNLATVNLKNPPLQKSEVIERPLHLLTLSAKNEKALRELAQRYAIFLESHPFLEIGDICFTANTGRSHFDYRLGIIASSVAQLREKLANFTTGQNAEGILQGRVPNPNRPKIAFLFAQEDSQSFTLGQKLYETQPTFRTAIDTCAEIFPSEFKVDRSKFRAFALEYALCQLWKSWGIEPSVVMGYGVGEYVAACAAGVLSLEDCLQLIIAASAEVTAGAVRYCEPKIPIISPKTGKVANDALISPDYWRDREKTSIKLTEGIKTLHQLGCEILIEISPQPTFLKTEASGLWLSSLSPEREDWQQILLSLLQLYLRGASVDWLGFDRDYLRRKVILPTYPFQRQRYWIETT
ncbi:MAG: type I polyketide synthase [Hydrococcus sp. C42_A2020_068]|nr:type I polyketide synthase [Hydrococcus sp. C42_A2020_068]